MNKICFALLLSLVGFNTFCQNVTKFKASESQRVLLDKQEQFLVAMERVSSSVEIVVDLSKSTISFIDKGKTDEYSFIKTIAPGLIFCNGKV